jgi:hypothetical protein
MFFHTNIRNSTIYLGCSLYTTNPLYNHANFSHILVCVTQFLVIICFSKKHHSLESLLHSLVAQIFCKAFFFGKCDHSGRNLGQILGF